MSITRVVRRVTVSQRPLIGVALVALVLVSAAAMPPSAPASASPARRRAPASSVANDPISRVSSLTQLVAGRTAAQANEQTLHDLAVRQLADAHLAENAALARADFLGKQADASDAAYRAARAQVAELASAYYRNAGSPGVLVQLLQSHSVAQYGYRRKLVSAIGDRQTALVKRALHARGVAIRVAREAADQTQRIHARVVSLQASIPAHAARIAALQAGLSSARYWLARWQSISNGVSTLIMSHSVLGPSELTAWFTATRRRGARITVSMDQLTQDYIEEGQAAQVRGDIAFAQSILETASFYFPAGGQLTPTDNNFAGINACDSCPTGSSFPDARTGVRAQMQLLRVYADPHLKNSDLNPPAVDPKLDTHFLKGTVPTWNGLTHTWATADAYGDRILEIYEQILGWLTDRAKI